MTIWACVMEWTGVMMMRDVLYKCPPYILFQGTSESQTTCMFSATFGSEVLPTLLIVVEGDCSLVLSGGPGVALATVELAAPRLGLTIGCPFSPTVGAGSRFSARRGCCDKCSLGSRNFVVVGLSRSGLWWLMTDMGSVMVKGGSMMVVVRGCYDMVCDKLRDVVQGEQRGIDS
ncbi:hypothetical protein TREMEDRAFT_60870 [Tremella mesenterica DSM 1558]|uniref:uncharacterized protein n=1 Tax=Tremella mesenterica (strain ATCC 24925 / CBS 8224 / DSM 1558 / NBRC 9311 / NRRL Y-6157 / RJB 2259-6 / UBC 559-6) TaxID=578456 RepID=UPI0003F49F67|nr:uncharacterized protein TREMEDRAFT_60870 [Tremella mesenterica DSM 1558]EIW70376.1 hypothetical protein TREMEDRAFT_60870 [Tremella mesenterica DSM 1558]